MQSDRRTFTFDVPDFDDCGGRSMRRVEVPKRVVREIRAADTATIERLRADNARLREALESVLDDDDCYFDHNGNCQAHFVTQPCEVAAAWALLKETNDGE